MSKPDYFYLGRVKVTKLVAFLVLFFCLVIVASPAEASGAGSISGLVFEDLNLNNTLDPSELLLVDWQVNLYQKDELVKSDRTNNEGLYYFNDLKPGDYQLELAIPLSWASVSGASSFITVRSGEESSVNFSNYQIFQEKRGMGPMMTISNVSVTPLSPTAVEIIWFTSHQATSQVIFSKNSEINSRLSWLEPDLGYSFSTSVNFETGTFHSMTLTNLEPGSTYYYRVVSLPDPKQWHSSLGLLGQEFSFTTETSSTIAPAEEEIIKDETSLPDPLDTPASSGTILGDKHTETPISTVEDSAEAGDIVVIEPTTTEKMTVEVLTEETKKEEETEEDSTTSPIKCAGYVWLMLILNLIAIIFVYQKNKNSKRATSQKIWWMITIVVIVPVILGYPECWLTIWLLIVLALTIIYLSNPGKGKPIPPPKTPPESSNPSASSPKIDKIGEPDLKSYSSPPIDVSPPKPKEEEPPPPIERQLPL